MLSDNLSILEDANPEFLSTLEALGDIDDAVESIVLSLAGAQERDAYLALADEFDTCADALEREPAVSNPKQEARLLELEKLMEDAVEVMLASCPDHIRKLHSAVRAAIDAEEAKA